MVVNAGERSVFKYSDLKEFNRRGLNWMKQFYELDKNLPNHEHIISQMELDCPKGVSAGTELFSQSILRQLVKENGSVADAFREICNQLNVL